MLFSPFLMKIVLIPFVIFLIVSAAPISLSAHSLIVSADILIVMTPKSLQLLPIPCDFLKLRPSPTRKSKNILDKIYLLIKNSHPPLLYIIEDINPSTLPNQSNHTFSPISQ